MKKVIKFLILNFSFFILAVSCSPQTAFSEYKDLPREGWQKDSIFTFNYEITDTLYSYDMVLYFRHTERYPYQNCWLFLENDGQKDTIDFYLADQRGRWLGNGFGRVKEMPILLQKDTVLGIGEHHLCVQQGMREDMLRGVESIGLEIIKH